MLFHWVKTPHSPPPTRRGRGLAAAAAFALATSHLFCLLGLKGLVPVPLGCLTGPVLLWPLAALPVGVVATGYGRRSASQRPPALAGVALGVAVLAAHLLAQVLLPGLAVGP